MNEMNNEKIAAEFQESGEVKESPESPIIQISEEEYKKLLKEVAEYKDKHLRLYAEFQNAQKRMDREKQEFVKYANESLIVEFLNVLDNLERVVDAAKIKHEDHKDFMKGVELVMAQINEMLARNNVKVIDAKGKKFDPHCHEILLQEETDQCEEGTVLEELQKGYMYGDRVVRTVKIKIAKAKSN